MGTRSTTKFIIDVEGEKETKTVCGIYRQYDGYPTGHGSDLAEFLNRGVLVNGIRFGADKLQFNGMGCLAAQVVAHLKDGSGGIYLRHPDDYKESYHYDVIAKYNDSNEPTGIIFKCYAYDKLLFEGTPEKFLECVDTLEND